LGFFFDLWRFYKNQKLKNILPMMNWEQLLSLKRFGDTEKRPRAKQDETRLGF